MASTELERVRTFLYAVILNKPELLQEHAEAVTHKLFIMQLLKQITVMAHFCYHVLPMVNYLCQLAESEFYPLTLYSIRPLVIELPKMY